MVHQPSFLSHVIQNIVDGMIDKPVGNDKSSTQKKRKVVKYNRQCTKGMCHV